MADENKVVDLVSVNEIRKKAVRGLLKKRAKQYDSDSDGEVGETIVTGAQAVQKYKKQKVADGGKKKKSVQKSSFQDAFKSIIGAKDNTSGKTATKKMFKED